MKRWLRDFYEEFILSKWPIWSCVSFLSLLNICAFIWFRPEGVLVGLKELGGYFFNRVLGFSMEGSDLAAHPLMEPTADVFIGYFFGAMVAALLAREFSLKIPRAKSEYVFAVAGGILMGLGGTIAHGCPVGLVWSITAAGSTSVFFTFLGYIIGSWVGSKFLLWFEERKEVELISYQEISSLREEKLSFSLTMQPIIAAIMLIFLIFYIWTINRYYGYHKLGVTFAFSMMAGFLFQKGNICFAGAFREPLLTGDASMSRGIALMIVLTAVPFFLLKATGVKPALAGIVPAGINVFIGCFLFGIGMSVHGGCASSSVWRAAEGQVKHMVAATMLVLTSAVVWPMRHYLVNTWITTPWGDFRVDPDPEGRIFLGQVFGIGWGLLIIIAVVIAWAFWSTWVAHKRTLRLLEE
jgi:hypothetical protein